MPILITLEKKTNLILIVLKFSTVFWLSWKNLRDGLKLSGIEEIVSGYKLILERIKTLLNNLYYLHAMVCNLLQKKATKNLFRLLLTRLLSQLHLNRFQIPSVEIMKTINDLRDLKFTINKFNLKTTKENMNFNKLV